jgi:ABC-2 type transport system permease protein
VSARRTLAVAARVLAQLRRDPRTLALLIVVPVVLVALFRWILDAQPAVFDRIGAPLVGIFPLVSMFLVTSITMLRERTSGTLERLMTMPLGRLDLLGGYGLAFGLLALVQGAAVSLVAIGLLGLDVAGSPLTVVLLATANALLGMSLGLLVSAFAATEFQAVQFMPAVILPQLLLCGVIVPVAVMAGPLRTAAHLLPMTYAYDALHQAATRPGVTAAMAGDVAVVLGVTAVALALGAATLRRRTA